MTRPTPSAEDRAWADRLRGHLVNELHLPCRVTWEHRFRGPGGRSWSASVIVPTGKQYLFGSSSDKPYCYWICDAKDGYARNPAPIGPSEAGVIAMLLQATTLVLSARLIAFAHRWHRYGIEEEKERWYESVLPTYDWIEALASSDLHPELRRSAKRTHELYLKKWNDVIEGRRTQELRQETSSLGERGGIADYSTDLSDYGPSGGVDMLFDAKGF